MTVNTNTKGRIQVAHFLSLVILLLASVNGIFTYSGAHLFIDEWQYALLFAIAVQFSIAIALIALPMVQGLGKPVLILIYLAALTLSTLSAYTFIYNAGASTTDARDQPNRLDTSVRTSMAQQLAEIVSDEKQYLQEQNRQQAYLKRQMEEEATRGFRSGLGAGKGPEYYRKQEQYDEAQVVLQNQQENYVALQQLFAEANVLLASSEMEQRDALIQKLSLLRTQLNRPLNAEKLDAIMGKYLAVIPSPVEQAMSRILDRKQYSIELVVSIIWAAVFDLLALFLGIVRYYLLRPDYSLLGSLYDGIANFAMFIFRLGNLRKDARQRYNHELEMRSHGTPLNSSEMQSFATFLMAGSVLSADKEQDAVAPLQKLISHIEPLKLPGNPKGVGVKYDSVEQQPELRTLMAMLIQNDVFLSNSEQDCFVLNPGSEMAQKILIFIRMGLNDPSRQKEISRLMTNSEVSA